MRKMIKFTSMFFLGFLVSCSSGDDKALNPEGENLVTDEAENSVDFSISRSTIANKFCVFGSYCDENGRQAEAIQYEVSAWTYSGDPEDPKAEKLYERQKSPLLATDNEDGTSSLSAEPLCLDLPNTPEEDQYFIEIYYEGLIRSGVITETQVKDLYVGEDRLDYYHFREGNCNLDDSPDLF